MAVLNQQQLDRTSDAIIGAAIEVHRELGPGLLESVYEVTLAEESRQRGFDVKCQTPVAVRYKSLLIEAGFRIDLLVNDIFIIELKAVEELAPIFKAQLITYLKLADKPTGLLINFNSVLLKDGVVRLFNKGMTT
ncbi:GxxExxY protein [Candidatus Sumerlaeota bacterium]|nr:GxxExxY protein [Candidatus Sumerlaeota bacterium]